MSDTDEQPLQESPILITDDDDDDGLEGPVIIDDSCDEDQTPSNEIKKNEFAISLHKPSYDVGKQDPGENVRQPPSDEPKAEVEISVGRLSSDEEPVRSVAKPRKRKNKTRHIPVTPGKPIKPSMPVPLRLAPQVGALSPVYVCLVESACPVY